jgi:hypothetical protein
MGNAVCHGIVADFRRANAEGRLRMQERLPLPLLGALVRHAEQLAALGRREGRPEAIEAGLLAIVMVELRPGAHRVLAALDQLQRAASDIGIDAESLFRRIATFATPDMATLLSRFAERDPGGRMR